jgi:hypothetical protein
VNISLMENFLLLMGYLMGMEGFTAHTKALVIIQPFFKNLVWREV